VPFVPPFGGSPLTDTRPHTVRSKWKHAAQRCDSLWLDLFAASASQWHLKPRRAHTPQIFGCGKMTLSQRASVPLALRTAEPPDLPAERATSALPAPPLSIRGFLDCWMTRHGASLQRLSLAGCGAWVTDDELQLVTQHCSDSLVCLDLCGCAQLSDFWVSDCLRECKSLTTVSLAMMGQLSAEALAHWAAEEPMQQQQQQDDPALQELAVPLPCALQRLDLTGCGGIGWFGLQTALRGGCGEGLLELSLRGQVAMPADGIVSVLRCCPNLLQLDASCCLSIDDSTVSEISSLCPQLRTLAISACPAVAMPLTTGKPHRTSHTCTPVTLRVRDSTSDLNTADVATVPLKSKHGCSCCCCLVAAHAVTAVGAACKQLKTLSLAGCLEVCPHDGLPALLSKIPQLERLDLAHCTQFHPVRQSPAVFYRAVAAWQPRPPAAGSVLFCSVRCFDLVGIGCGARANTSSCLPSIFCLLSGACDVGYPPCRCAHRTHQGQRPRRCHAAAAHPSLCRPTGSSRLGALASCGHDTNL
jgi:hypothetical protein